jgi:hypothetical protein
MDQDDTPRVDLGDPLKSAIERPKGSDRFPLAWRSSATRTFDVEHWTGSMAVCIRSP